MMAIPKDRLILLDVLRGVAIIAMIIFHFTWDLAFFGVIEKGTLFQPEWTYFARSIAASFLCLAGFSLILGHGAHIRVRSFLKRFIKIAGAASIISLATFYAMPNAPIFFGILHSIAAASVIGLLARKLPVLLLVLLAVIIFFAPHFLRSEFFNTPFLWWVGLSSPPPISNDYVPLLPWLAPFFIGMALAKISITKGWLEKLGRVGQPPSQPLKTLSFMGRHSLIIYLIHQPIMLGLFWLVFNLHW